MSKSAEILIDVLKQASVRIHWAFLVSLIVCAIIGSSLYSEHISYNNGLLKSAQIFVMRTEADLNEIEARNIGDVEILKPNGRYVNVAPLSTWRSDDFIKYSELIYKQQRAINALKEVNLVSVSAPIVSFPISTNELDVFGGIILIVLSMWIYFSMSQIVHIIENPKTFNIISAHASVVKYMFATVRFHTFTMGFLIVCTTIFMPFIVMCVSTWLWFKGWNTVHTVDYSVNIRDPYITALIIRFVIAGILLYFALCVSAGWTIMTQKFNQYTE